MEPRKIECERFNEQVQDLINEAYVMLFTI